MEYLIVFFSLCVLIATCYGSAIWASKIEAQRKKDGNILLDEDKYTKKKMKGVKKL